MVLLAGTLISPSSRLTKSSRNLARTPMRLRGLEADNQGLDLGRQLVGVNPLISDTFAGAIVAAVGCGLL